jgi:hypothetical protein
LNKPDLGPSKLHYAALHCVALKPSGTPMFYPKLNAACPHSMQPLLFAKPKTLNKEVPNKQHQEVQRSRSKGCKCSPAKESRSRKLPLDGKVRRRVCNVEHRAPTRREYALSLRAQQANTTSSHPWRDYSTTSLAYAISSSGKKDVPG